MNETGSRFLTIAGISGVLGSVLLLTSDLVHITLGYMFEWTIGLWLAFLLMMPAVLGFTYFLASRGSRLAYVGGALAFLGLGAGSGMQAMFRVHAVLLEQGSEAVVEQLRGTFKLVAATQMIGLNWPLGLLLLSIANLMVNRDNWVLSALLAVAAVAFPIGRIAFSNTGVILSGAIFVVAFLMIARLINSRSSTLA